MNSSNPPFLQHLNNATTSLSQMESCVMEPQHLSITVFLCLVFLGGFLLNSFSMWVFCCRMSKWSSGNILQFHLAMSDVIVAPAAPLIGVYFVTGQWTLGRFLCQLKITLITVHFYGSILFLMLIGIHRYVAVVHYKKATLMKQTRFVRKLCGGVWFLLLTGGSATFVLFHESKVGNHTLCLSIHQNEYITTYFTINFFLVGLGLLVPFLVLVVCYTSLVSSVSRIKANTAKGQSIKSKSCRMVAMCLIIFAVCFMPFSVVRSVALVVKIFFPSYCALLLHLETAYYVSWILAGANCCLDPLLYCFGSNNFNKTIRRSFKIMEKKDVCHENEQDSQDLTRVTHSTGSI